MENPPLRVGSSPALHGRFHQKRAGGESAPSRSGAPGHRGPVWLGRSIAGSSAHKQCSTPTCGYSLGHRSTTCCAIAAESLTTAPAYCGLAFLSQVPVWRAIVSPGRRHPSNHRSQSTMLDQDSPLHRLPAGLRRRQKLMLDGIGISIDMATMSYARLQASLLAWTQGVVQGQPQPTAGAALIMMDAWMIIDAVNRLRALVAATRGLKRGPAVVSFNRSVEGVETLRNAVQHMIGEVEELEKNGHPLWGSLSWNYLESPATGTGR